MQRSDSEKSLLDLGAEGRDQREFDQRGRIDDHHLLDSDLSAFVTLGADQRRR